MLGTFSQRHPLLWAYLFFLYFSAATQLLILTSGMSGTVGLRQAFFMSLLWLIPLLVWPHKAKPIAAIIGVFLWAGSLVGFSYWLVFGQDFSQSVIFIIFESSMEESLEFIQSYLKVWHVGAMALFSAAPYFLWRKITPATQSRSYRYVLAGAFALFVFWPFLNTLIIKGEGWQASRYHQVVRLEPATPWNLVMGYVKYREQLTAMEAILASNREIPPLHNLVERQPDAEKTLVLVIGESTNRQRMGAYGYTRDTTPQLDSLGKELIVFKDVVTSRPYTIEALQQALSFADSTTISDYFSKPTLLNMMQQAGYDVTWITNQQTQTKRNTMLTSLSQLADHQVYLNNNRAQNADQYDGEVLAPFAKILKSSARKKMIIVHLLGTHRKYDYRFPENFNYFTDRNGAPDWVADDNLQEYNDYDNAIRYNDFVVASLIDTLRQQSGQSLLMYFADHGEEVYDYPEKQFCGRSEEAPTAAMYTVPFMAWANPEYAAANNTEQWQRYRNRPYSTADFIYAWADAAGLSFDSFKADRSIFSAYFSAHSRLIGNPLEPKKLRNYSDVFAPETRPTEALTNQESAASAASGKAG